MVGDGASAELSAGMAYANGASVGKTGSRMEKRMLKREVLEVYVSRRHECKVSDVNSVHNIPLDVPVCGNRCYPILDDDWE